MKREGLSDHMIQGYLMPWELTTSNRPNASRGLSAALAGVTSHQKGLALLERLPSTSVVAMPPASTFFQNSRRGLFRTPT